MLLLVVTTLWFSGSKILFSFEFILLYEACKCLLVIFRPTFVFFIYHNYALPIHKYMVLDFMILLNCGMIVWFWSICSIGIYKYMYYLKIYSIDS